MRSPLLTALLIVCCNISIGFAQSKVKKQTTPKTEIINNAAVLELIKAGLDDDIVISKIENSQTNFDMSSSALITLKNQKVSKEIIKAMMNKANAGDKNQTPQANTSKAANSIYPPLDLVNQIYYFNRSSRAATPLETAAAVMKTKTKLLGYGGASVVYLVDGEKSPIRLTDTSNVSFLVHASGVSPSDFALYKLTIEKKKRQATTQKINSGFKGFGGSAMDGGVTLSFNVSQVKDGIYQLTPTKHLEKGEYFFAVKGISSGGTIDVFAFGLD